MLDDAAVEVTRDGRRAVPLLADDSALDRPSSSLSLSELVDAAFLRDVSFEGDEHFARWPIAFVEALIERQPNEALRGSEVNRGEWFSIFSDYSATLDDADLPKHAC